MLVDQASTPILAHNLGAWDGGATPIRQTMTLRGVIGRV